MIHKNVIYRAGFFQSYTHVITSLMILGTSVQISTLTIFIDFGSTTPLVGSMLSRTTPSYDILNAPKRNRIINRMLHNIKLQICILLLHIWSYKTYNADIHKQYIFLWKQKTQS